MVRNRCAYCGLAIHQGRGGWRHTVSGLRICQPVTIGRIATPRTPELKTPVLPRPRAAGTGRVPAATPRSGAQAGPGGGGTRVAAARSRILDEAQQWQRVKAGWPQAAATILCCIELGSRVQMAIARSTR